MTAVLAICATTLLVTGIREANGPRQEPEQSQIVLTALERSIVDQTNAERKRYGLPSLAVDYQLVESARRHCSWMTRYARLQHVRLPVGENIAMGYRTTQEVLRAWMHSPGHRANILNRSYRSIGVAANPTSGGTMYWCQQFRRKAAAGPPKTASAEVASGDVASAASPERSPPIPAQPRSTRHRQTRWRLFRRR
jgi:uncharacterized protein YkwD